MKNLVLSAHNLSGIIVARLSKTTYNPKEKIMLL